MEHPAYAMAAIFPYYRIAVVVGYALDGAAYVAKSGAWPDQFYPCQHGFTGDAAEPLSLNIRLANSKHSAAVTMEIILNDGDINIDDVAFFQFFIGRNTMADHVVDRGTDGFGETAVVQRGRNGLLGIDDVVVTDAVQFIGRNPWLHVCANHVEDISGESARDPHFGLLGGAFNGYSHLFVFYGY
jgi:hypothetical protein